MNRNLSRSYASLEEVRADIDKIDDEIVALLGRRSACVDAVVQFKSGPEDAHRPDRVEQVVQKARKCAQSSGASPDMVEHLYREMIAWFTQDEAKKLKEREANDPGRT